MTTVKITGLEKATARLKTQIGSAVKKSGFEEDMKELVVEEIRDKGLKPTLASSTIKSRKYMARNNATHPSYRASKSNLTLIGELLDSLNAKFQVSKLIFTFSAKGKHSKYKRNDGKAIKGKSVSNQSILEIQNETRPILQVFNDDRFKSKVENILIKKIKAFLKRDT